MKDFKYLKLILSKINLENLRIAKVLTTDKLIIDSFELESLINHNKFNLPAEDIDVIGVELD